MSSIRRHLIVLFLAVGLHSASAFSLLGPFEPWMTTNLGFNNPLFGLTDIGGPKNLGEGYRWNIPVITYGYDQSFLDYFGTNGVAAVESAIQILNSLPPASDTNLNSLPLTTTLGNFTAGEQGLYDLKSSALGLVMEQLGLASPTRFVFTLSDFKDSNDYTVLMRSFDQVTLESSPYVNGVAFTYNVEDFDQSAVCIPTPTDPVYRPNLPVVADYTFTFDAFTQHSTVGIYYTGLTRDDIGGLYYLYGTNNLALESLIPGVRSAGTNACDYVNTAVRPGVGKLTFQRLDYDQCHGGFVPMSYSYVDAYLTNGTLQHQTLEREIKEPDILFSAKHLGPYQFTRTGTTNWVNNGAPLQNGPGVIQPPVAINFGRLGPYVSASAEDIFPPNSGSFYFQPHAWASFDGTTNAPTVYPINSGRNNSTEIYFRLYGNPSIANTQPPKPFTWILNGQHNDLFFLQTSSNLCDWFTIAAVTNLGQDVNFFDTIFPNVPRRFFRVVPQ